MLILCIIKYKHAWDHTDQHKATLSPNTHLRIDRTFLELSINFAHITNSCDAYHYKSQHALHCNRVPVGAAVCLIAPPPSHGHTESFTPHSRRHSQNISTANGFEAEANGLWCIQSHFWFSIHNVGNSSSHWRGCHTIPRKLPRKKQQQKNDRGNAPQSGEWHRWIASRQIFWEKQLVCR